MKRIHNVKRTIALFLAMLMAATSTAFADWDSFQGSNDNNGTTDIAITSTSPTSTTVTLPNNGASTGVDVEPLVYGSRIYALYNGGSTSGGDASIFSKENKGDDKTGGARLAAVDASTEELIWNVQVGEADNVSQIATPVITSDGKTLYGTYTYTQDMMNGKTVTFSGDYSDGKIGANGTAIATISNVTLPGGYGNLQVGTDITSTGTDQQIGTVSIKNGESVVQSFTSSSYETYNFNVYYSDGTPVPGGTYTIEVSVRNTTDKAIPWSAVSLLVKPEYVSLGSGVTSVSTPTVVSTGDNCNIYVGYSDASYGANNGIKVVTSVSFNSNAVKDVCKADGPVQSSPVVYRNSSGTNYADYIYFTTNTWNGTGYRCTYNGTTGSEAVKMADVSGYALQGFAMGSYLDPDTGVYIDFGAFGNDNCQVVIVQ